MKKKILVLVMSVVMMLTMVGCNVTGLELLSKLKDVSTWEAMETSTELKLGITVEDIRIGLDLVVEGYMNTDPMAFEGTITVKDLTMTEAGVSVLPTGFDLSPINFFMDEMKFYISTTYFEELLALEEDSDLEGIDLSKEYVGIDFTNLMALSGVDMSDYSALTAEGYKLYEALPVDLPIVKSGDQYTISLAGETLIDMVFEFYKASLTMQKDLYIEQYVLLGLSAEEAEMIYDEMMTLFNDELKEMLLVYISEGKVDATYGFGKDSYTVDVAVSLPLVVDEEVCLITLEQKAVTTKAMPKTIVFPTGIEMFDFAELMMGSDYAAVDVYLEMDDLVMVDDELYVPFRKVVEQLGCTAVYDKANQVVYIEELGIVIEDFFILQGTSYVSSDALEEGFMLYNLVLSYYID